MNPNDAGAHDGYASWLLCHGRTEEALAWARRARELDPLGNGGTSIGWILFMAHRYDEAIREIRSELAVHPDSAFAHWELGMALIGNGQVEEAIPVMEKAALMTDRNPGSLELLATAHARAGHRAEALRLIEELKKRRETGYVPAGVFIFPYLALGENDEAFVWFERAYQEQAAILQWLKLHPFFDPVRNDPRFVDLVRRVGLN
jgi:tetratricopeptide (TPR) repeat protein